MVIEIDNISNVLKIAEHLKGVIFDLDDTLYNERNYVRSGFNTIGKAFPQFKDLSEKLWKAFTDGKPAVDVVVSELGLQKEKYKQKFLEIYRCHKPDIKLNENVYEVLSKLKKDNKKLGLITDGRPEGQHNKIEALGIADFFNKIIITDELGGYDYRKPNPLAFNIMKKSLNLRYEDMCYIGDNINKDFVAPEKLGIISVHLNNFYGLYV